MSRINVSQLGGNLPSLRSVGSTLGGSTWQMTQLMKQYAHQLWEIIGIGPEPEL